MIHGIEYLRTNKPAEHFSLLVDVGIGAAGKINTFKTAGTPFGRLGKGSYIVTAVFPG